MELKKIITLASKEVMLQFYAMERSLRATGCRLPLWVIPYNDNLFELPENANWWRNESVVSWLKSSHPMMRKYQCLLEERYQFVDTDICFLRNPEEALRGEEGFVTSCGHWRDPNHTLSDESAPIIMALSSNWQRFVFNAGQFASDRAIYDESGLRARAEQYRRTCLEFPHHDQPGLNLLVLSAGIRPKNLTLHGMESTWAGDYPGELPQWGEGKPYIIHWAGLKIDGSRAVDELFLRHLSGDERAEFLAANRPKSFWRFGF